MKAGWLALFLAAALPALAAALPDDEARPGGAATSKGPRNLSAFSQPSGNLSFARQFDFRLGDGVFRKLWVSAPSSTRSSDGLGPLYNARACQSCHLKDGRGRPPAAGEQPSSLLLRLARADGSPDPLYGRQIQSFAIQGHEAEAALAVDHVVHEVRLGDGTTVRLRRPVWRAAWLQGAPAPDTTLSPRVAPPMIGMGLLELIPEADILAREDPADRDGDGIRGIANREPGRPGIGRFGWKAGAASVAEQTANAFLNDMGLGNPVHPAGHGDCTAAQAACRAAPDGGETPADGGPPEPEVPQRLFDLTVFYARNLAVPTRPRAGEAEVRRGRDVFRQIGCAACHVPRQVTGPSDTQPHLAGQVIWPYSDLLLHDMGEGLADGQVEGRASGRHWRTPPLWGLGLTHTVSGHWLLLHDGRADGPLEAILWHGGEAAGARDRAAALSPAERAALLAFLGSL
ncbi:MAG: di-heme oxidoredictase family protein [Thalassobaculales bacterium]